MTEDSKGKPFLTPGEAAAIVGVSTSTIRRMFDAGDLPGFRIAGGKHRRISALAVDRFIEQHGGEGDAAKTQNGAKTAQNEVS